MISLDIEVCIILIVWWVSFFFNLYICYNIWNCLPILYSIHLKPLHKRTDTISSFSSTTCCHKYVFMSLYVFVGVASWWCPDTPPDLTIKPLWQKVSHMFLFERNVTVISRTSLWENQQDLKWPKTPIFESVFQQSALFGRLLWSSCLVCLFAIMRSLTPTGSNTKEEKIFPQI